MSSGPLHEECYLLVVHLLRCNLQSSLGSSIARILESSICGLCKAWPSKERIDIDNLLLLAFAEQREQSDCEEDGRNGVEVVLHVESV